MGRQRVRRKVMEKRQVRGGIFEGIRIIERSAKGAEGLLRVLQPKEASTGIRFQRKRRQYNDEQDEQDTT